jgi:hypothetical protein
VDPRVTGLIVDWIERQVAVSAARGA